MNESVRTWLAEFEADPQGRLHDLIMGRTAVPAWSRSTPREIFLEICQTHAETLDAAVASWLDGYIFRPPPGRTPEIVWASNLQDVFRAVAGLPLPAVSALLRRRFRDFRSWLRPFRFEESLDPEAAFLAALARAETNQGLEGMWRSIALRGDHEPAYYSDVGLLGLRKARDDHGQLPAKAPFLLLATLVDLADVPGSKHDEWDLTARALMASYHFSEPTWLREFEPVLAARSEANNGPKWLRRILPGLKEKREVRERARVDLPNKSLAEVNQLVGAVDHHGPVVPGMPEFLERHRHFARITNDPHFLVRTFNRLAEAARRHDPEWAIARAEEALEWDPGDARNWTVLARCLWERGKEADLHGEREIVLAARQEAIDTLWTARYRFPCNAYVRTELARFYREGRDFETAEAITREAFAEFPRNDTCRCLLGELLADQGKFSEAERVFRQAIDDFPASPAPSNALANLFRRREKLEAAEDIYRTNVAKFANDPYCRNGLADILFHRSAANGDATEREEARSLFEEAAALNNPYARRRLSDFDDRWSRFAAHGLPAPPEKDDAEPTTELVTPTPDQMRPAQRLGMALVRQWQAGQCGDPDQANRRLDEAHQLLALPDAAAGECRAAFVEARGFLLLARGRAADAAAYFLERITAFRQQHSTAKTAPLGLRLGFADARARLRLPLEAQEEQELQQCGPEGSILPLVLMVLRLIEVDGSDEMLRDVLVELYPRVREFGRTSFTSAESEAAFDEPPDDAQPPPTAATAGEAMLAGLAAVHVFDETGVTSIADLQSQETLARIRQNVRENRLAFSSTLEKLATAA